MPDYGVTDGWLFPILRACARSISSCA
jgi:hypothetical protein